MQYNNTSYSAFEPLLEVASFEPHYYDPLQDCYPFDSSLYIDPTVSHYFSDVPAYTYTESPQTTSASLDEFISPSIHEYASLPMVSQGSVSSLISTPSVYYQASPYMANLSTLSESSEELDSALSFIASLPSLAESFNSPDSVIASPPPSELQNNGPPATAGGGKKRATRITRAKRNQVLQEKTGVRVKKNNKQENDDGDKQFKCTIHDCGKVFKRAEHLKRHVKSIHDKIKDYKCNFPGCDRAFSRSDNLNQHLRTHRSESIKKTKETN